MARPVGSKNSYRVSLPKGADCHHWKGGRRVAASGYVQIYLGSTEPRYRYEHDLIAERVIGRPLPSAACVHHVDQIKTNNANNNLVICQDDSYHYELHRKLAVLRAGGNPWTERLCCMCKLPRPAASFYRQSRKVSPFNPDGRASVCGDCGRERAAAYRRRVAA
jgi:hypothetical protein